VVTARARQQERYAAAGVRTNAEMTPALLTKHCILRSEGRRLLETASRRLALSARGYQRVRKVARTIADLAGADQIGAEHVGEALQFRMLT
jgi:magnesium chelatase family protein